MQQQKKRISQLFTALRVGWFLAIRQLKRSSYATTSLIILVMMLTFLNLVVVRGVLVGLIQGSTNVYKSNYAGDILISALPKSDFIEQSPSVLSIVQSLPWVETATYRYLAGVTVEAGYKEKVKLTDDPNTAGGFVSGIDPALEDAVTNLSSKIVEGSYLNANDADSILIGANLLKKYVNVEARGLNLLEDINIGDRVRLTINGAIKEFTIKGIVESKTDAVDSRVFMIDSTLRNIIGRNDYNVAEIAISLKPGTDSLLVKDALLRAGVGQYALVQTWEESLPKFLLDIKNTFGILGNVIGSIGLIAASITIFIVIFVNAITRRKFIGILKGIGIDSVAIEFSYVLQSFFYALIGIGGGLLILYGFLVPYVTANPIKFPFSDGILVAEYSNTMIRALILMTATLIAGYIPARIVVKQNTLDAILGRN